MSKEESIHQQEPQKAIAEMTDEILFRQPECTHLGDCPICYLPLLEGKYKITFFDCCSKTVCTGCWLANNRGEKSVLEQKCMFCRTPVSNDRNFILDRMTKRTEVGDPIAMTRLGVELLDKKDYEGAFQYLSKAVALGYTEAHYIIAGMNTLGVGVGEDEAKMIHHLEQASIGGHPSSRYLLAKYEEENGRMDRAAKHCIIAAKLGHDDALKMVKECYISGFVTKEDFAAALRGHQAAIDATKSDQRTKAEEFYTKFFSSSAN